MGKCKYCGQTAGFLKSKHKDCEAKYINGKQEIVDVVKDVITNTSDFKNLQTNVKKIALSNYINQEEIENLYVEGFDRAVDTFLDDSVLTKDEEEKISDFQHSFDFSQDTLNRNDSLNKLMKSLILRDVLEGKIPEQRLNIQGHLPFNSFIKSLYLIQIFVTFKI